MNENEILEGNKLIAEFMELPKYTCDNCGSKNPETFPNSRLTVCCSTYDRDHENCFYKTKDANGKDVFSIGKTWLEDIKSYNSAWNALMPVVEKIESMGHSVLIDGTACKIFMDYDYLYAYKDSKLEAVYDTVVKFIHWHNTNKQ